MDRNISGKLRKLAACVGPVSNLQVERKNKRIHTLKKIIYDDVRSEPEIRTFKDDPVVRAHRESSWKLDIDPTKTEAFRRSSAR